MKNIQRDILGRFKSLKINLLDGQGRGEVIARRAFVLLVGALVIYLLLLAFVGKKDQNVEVVKATEVEIGVDGAGNVVREGEVVNGQKVEVENGKAVYIQPYNPKPVVNKQVKAIKKFTQSYRGSRIDDKYFTLLDKNCSDEALRTVVAISVAESGMGRDVKRQSNFFGWFKGGNRNYDPSQEVMAKEICNGVQKSYIGIGNSVAKAKKYVGSNPSNWLRNYRWAYEQMAVK